MSRRRPASPAGRVFRYYASKNAIPWGDFDAHLGHLRELLDDVDPDMPLGEALRAALLAFNTFDESETVRHRERMRVILQTAELQAYSMTMYAGWREVIAEFVGRRIGVKTTDLLPQTVAWMMLGVALSAYEHWLDDESVSLPEALGRRLRRRWRRAGQLNPRVTMSTAAADHLRSQGQFCAGMGSTMYGELLRAGGRRRRSRTAFSPTILAGHEDDSVRMAVPLRLLGGLHRLVLDGRAPALRRWYPSTGGSWDADAAWPEIVLAAADHADYLRAALDQPPQTNEVGRSAALIGALLRSTDRFALADKAFRDRLQRRAEPAGRPLPLSLCRRRLGTDRFAGDHRRRVAWSIAAERAVQIVERHGYDIAPLDAHRHRRAN